MTVMSDPAVAELGAALYTARRSGVPIEPLTDSYADMSVTDAYRVQSDLVARLLADGDRVVGYKLGLTSGPMQRMLGIDVPDFAPVLASHVLPDGAEVRAGAFIHPNGPAGRNLSYRAGYYEAGSTNEAERVLATAEIMINDVPQPDIHVDALPSVFMGSGERAAVPVVVDVNGSDLMRIKDDPILIADIFVYAFDANGGVADSLFQRLTIDTDKVGAKLNEGGVKYLGTLSLAPGAYAIKTLVRLPEIGRNGFVRHDVVVPARNATIISPPLFFADASRWVLVKGSTHDPSGAYPFVVGDSTFVPSAAVRLQNGDRRRFVVFAPHAPADAVLDVKPAAAFVGRRGDAFIFDLHADGSKRTVIDAALRGSNAASSVTVETP